MDLVAIAQVANDVLAAVGGKQNVASNAMCMTRLRLELKDPDAIDYQQLLALPSVLGVAPLDPTGLEIVFGPAIIEELFEAFSQLTGLEQKRWPNREVVVNRTNSELAQPYADIRQVSSSSENLPDGLDAEEVSWLRSIVGLDEGANPRDAFSSAFESYSFDGRQLLVVNGPNLNLLGIREPGIYGNTGYEELVKICKEAGKEAGFEHTHCYQSNHEGDLVDEIQMAYGVYDAIVINPGAYTHTSIALLDALKAVNIPTIEVHISKVDEREKFRQVSYVRAACIETIAGEGIDGYAHAICDLADHLDDLEEE